VPVTSTELRAVVAQELESGRVPTGPREPEWLLESAGVDPRSFGPDTMVPKGLVQASLRLAARRAAGEPLQYVTGLAGFRRLLLQVGPGVFIPRPETELVAGRVVTILPHNGLVVDVGTGSGAIALAIADERKDARVVATEISRAALSWARLNRSRLKLGVELLSGDLLEALPASMRGKVDVIVSNPPYVATMERDALPEDVVGYEPGEALFAGTEGIEVIRRLCKDARDWIRPGGRLILEIAPGQRHAVLALLTSEGYMGAVVQRDLTGQFRLAEAIVPE
jgi:release factor glutamine methyltransferase